MTTPRDLIYRSVAPDLELRKDVANPDHAGRVVEGIAVPYGVPCRINESLVEQFAPGVVRHQMSAAHRVHFTRDHLALGGVLIGRALELRDDARGLWGSFLVSRTQEGLDTLELLRDGALDELSVGFRERPRGQRTLPSGVVERTQVDLFEVSVVRRGAYGRGATVKALRAEIEDEASALKADPERVAEDADVRERLQRLEQLLARLPLLPLP